MKFIVPVAALITVTYAVAIPQEALHHREREPLPQERRNVENNIAGTPTIVMVPRDPATPVEERDVDNVEELDPRSFFQRIKDRATGNQPSKPWTGRPSPGPSPTPGRYRRDTPVEERDPKNKARAVADNPKIVMVPREPATPVQDLAPRSIFERMIELALGKRKAPLIPSLGPSPSPFLLMPRHPRAVARAVVDVPATPITPREPPTAVEPRAPADSSRHCPINGFCGWHKLKARFAGRPESPFDPRAATKMRVPRSSATPINYIVKPIEPPAKSDPKHGRDVVFVQERGTPTESAVKREYSDAGRLPPVRPQKFGRSMSAFIRAIKERGTPTESAVKREYSDAGTLPPPPVRPQKFGRSVTIMNERDVVFVQERGTPTESAVKREYSDAGTLPPVRPQKFGRSMSEFIRAIKERGTPTESAVKREYSDAGTLPPPPVRPQKFGRSVTIMNERDVEEVEAPNQVDKRSVTIMNERDVEDVEAPNQVDKRQPLPTEERAIVE